jgi:hypothetical protein
MADQLLSFKKQILEILSSLALSRRALTDDEGGKGYCHHRSALINRMPAFAARFEGFAPRERVLGDAVNQRVVQIEDEGSRSRIARLFCAKRPRHSGRFSYFTNCS